MINTHKDSRHPFEIWLLGASALAGTFQLVSGARPGSLSSQLSPIMQTIWAVLLGGGALIALTGVFWSDKTMRSLKIALELESIGLLAVAVACVEYSTAVHFAVGLDGIYTWIVMGTFAVCCLIRRRRIEKVLKPNRSRKKKRPPV